MAEETKTPPQSSAPSPASAGDEETIDLAGLVENIDMTPTDGIGKPVDAAKASAKGVSESSVADPAANEPIYAEELSPEQLDEILLQEDPSMAAQMEAIRGAGFSAPEETNKAVDQEDESLEELLRRKGQLTFRERFRLRLLKFGSFLRATKRVCVRAVKDSKGLLREAGGKLKHVVGGFLQRRKAGLQAGTHWLKSRSLAQKFSLLFSVIVIAALVFVSLRTIRGTLLPKTERLWVASFAERADGVFKYAPDVPFEDFNDPLLHPEFVVIVERIVVNLARSAGASDSANPMMAFELYVQTDNQETAVEIKDRNVEIRDGIARSVERMTYQDLAGEEGKTKLKLLLRKDLNEILTKGKVRRVFFKTIVLNPE